MPAHVWYECPKPCPQPGYCQYCEGGLGLCTVCGCLEGSLPTECPGVKCYAEKGDDIYAGKIDFINGEWVKAASVNSPARYRKEK